ncbi:MAG: pyridoxal phosphate-dependent aminotransferase [Chloroflexi bacterium]|nr:pyridoxal phosphate-dependent aminotransferase [Chloroflexota bacterium]
MTQSTDRVWPSSAGSLQPIQSATPPPVSPGSVRVSRRAAALRRTAAKEIGDVAAGLRAAGREVIGLQGSPWWLPPEHVLAAATAAYAQTSVAHSQGSPEVRRAFSLKLERDNGVLVDSEREVLVTNAGMHALHVAFTTLLDPGDEVVLCAPIFYFFGAIELAGGVPVYAGTRQEDGWRWDIDALAKAITPRTKLIVVNTPTNPTGYVATRAELEAILDLARYHDLLVLADEAYENMVFDGARHVTFASLPGARERTVTVYSLTKTYALRQWRIGFLAAPADLTAHFRKVLEWDVLACNHVAQAAAAAALTGPQEWVSDIAARFQRCRDLMIAGLRETPGLTFAIPTGAPFLFVNVAELGLSGDELSHVLLHEHGVVTDPGSFFGSAKHVRLPFGGEDEVVREAARRLDSAARTLAG